MFQDTDDNASAFRWLVTWYEILDFDIANKQAVDSEILPGWLEFIKEWDATESDTCHRNKRIMITYGNKSSPFGIQSVAWWKL